MNEQIDKLVEIAIIQNETDWIDFRKALTGSGSLYLHVFAEKFAELIVKECCQTVERRYKYSKGAPVSFWEMSQDVQDLLKEQFRVKE